jgi:K+ transporter
VGRVPILHERVEQFGLAPFHAAKNDAIDIAKTQAAEIMAATSLAFYRVARIRFGWSPLLAGTVVGGFLVIDLAFLGANLLKFVDGGYVPAIVGCAFVALMVIWARGRSLLRAHYEAQSEPTGFFDLPPAQVVEVGSRIDL